MTLLHTPVLLEQVIQVLKPVKGQTYLDLTAGYGGHAEEILKCIGTSGQAILVDRDVSAIKVLKSKFDDRAEFIHADYLEATQRLHDNGTFVDLILLDLGVSSPQLDRSERGFSFKTDGPLDMRMDQTQSITAQTIVNTYKQDNLARIIKEYGEERHYKAIAREIVAKRPFETTKQLADLVRSIVGRSGEIDGATRTFQAIRIEVNSELTQLQLVLPKLLEILTPGGRIAVITFHSLEDRIVKNFFDIESRDCICPPKQPICTCSHRASLHKLLSKPIKGSDIDAFNPRARSAKLRAAEKITQK